MSQKKYYRDTWAEINLNAIRRNIRNLRAILPEEKKIMAVVKANAYGHGDIQVAETALDEGAAGLAVALLDEAIHLRKAGIVAPILVMGWVRPEDAVMAEKYNITVTVFQKEWVEQARNVIHRPVGVHIKVDTGMGRIGVRTSDELEQLLTTLNDSPFRIEGLFTHFATADEKEITYFTKQLERFRSLLQTFYDLYPDPVMIHTGNSAASMRFPDEMYDAVRFGIGMYGLYPSPDVKGLKPIELEQAFSLHSRLTHVKKLPPGEAISYGATYQTKTEEWIGTVPVGYADGWVRRLKDSDVLIDGKRVPIVGRICMDQFMVRLDGPYEIGTKVTLIGRQKGQEISVDDVADRLGTINYEVPCLISYRVPRVYTGN